MALHDGPASRWSRQSRYAHACGDDGSKPGLRRTLARWSATSVSRRATAIANSSVGRLTLGANSEFTSQLLRLGFSPLERVRADEGLTVSPPAAAAAAAAPQLDDISSSAWAFEVLLR